jgi:hypothetical protein
MGMSRRFAVMTIRATGSTIEKASKNQIGEWGKNQVAHRNCVAEDDNRN